LIVIKHLFVKGKNGNPMRPVIAFGVGPKGIEGNVYCQPLRQVLIIPTRSLTEFNLNPGDLRENIVVDGLDLHKLESGTVIRIGGVRIRLTFHCEPCRAIVDKVNLKKITHKRGVLGSFLNNGFIKVGDAVVVADKRFDAIPYRIDDRIKWYLDKQDKPVPVSKLAFDIGLSNSYCRAIPNLVRNRDDIRSHLILYKNNVRRKSVDGSAIIRRQLSLFDP
jgi:hypothetical protein